MRGTADFLETNGSEQAVVGDEFDPYCKAETGQAAPACLQFGESEQRAGNALATGKGVHRETTDVKSVGMLGPEEDASKAGAGFPARAAMAGYVGGDGFGGLARGGRRGVDGLAGEARLDQNGGSRCVGETKKARVHSGGR